MVRRDDRIPDKKHYTLMVVPHKSSRTILKMRLPTFIMHILSGLVIAAGIILFIVLIYSTQTMMKVVHYYSLLSQNKRQGKQIHLFLQETNRLRQEIKQLEGGDSMLRGLLGLPRR
ncbi:hypothetical protein ACFL56_00635 [Candidatus Margulisiibacteriota bacterium]